MPNDQDSSPYRPPIELAETSGAFCPRCHGEMDEGSITSTATIRWRSKSAGLLRKFLLGGRKLGRSKSGFPYRIPAFRCHHCELVILK
ncbi:PF20097 family protein [Rhodopirellula sp. MGV]|uniref:PF20097 family protein n=1 Tax=Rhodopirellula sp. MGV TaxID=2023130 RepID=UPI003965631A